MKKILFLLLIYFPLLSQDYKIPPDVIRSLIEADPQPTISLTKDGDLGLVLKDLNEKKTPLKEADLVQVSVDVNLKEVSIDKLTSFLKSVESKEGEGLVKVTRLKTKTRFDNDQLLDVRMTV